MRDYELENVRAIINERDDLKIVVSRQELVICNLREELANMRLVLSRSECACGGKCK